MTKFDNLIFRMAIEYLQDNNSDNIVDLIRIPHSIRNLVGGKRIINMLN